MAFSKNSVKVIVLVVFFLASGLYLMYTTIKTDGESIIANPFKKASSEPPKRSFMADLAAFPFEKARKALNENDLTVSDKLTTDLVSLMSEYILISPQVPINASCSAPPIEFDCKKYPDVFTGKTRERRLGMAVQFGFDVDTLEVALHQYYGIVDKFVLLEATRTHYRKLKKPLLWEALKNTPRFKLFKDFVVHIVLDDSYMASSEQTEWGMESAQEHLRWDRFLAWNDASKLFSDDDVIGLGDTDEVPSRENLALLKNCELREHVKAIDIGIWFPYGKIDQAFRTDWPVSHAYPYSLGDPTFRTLRQAKEQGKNGGVPSRNRGTSGTFLLGGMHMTHDGYLPFQINKHLTCTECGINLKFLGEMEEAVKDRERFLEYERSIRMVVWDRIVPVDSLDEENKRVVRIPWFLECNRERFPQWEHKHDTRLD